MKFDLLFGPDELSVIGKCPLNVAVRKESFYYKIVFN